MTNLNNQAALPTQPSDAKSTRRQNLALLCDQIGMAELARRVDTDPAYLWQCISGWQNRGVGHALARRIELALGKPHGWMDQPPAVQSADTIGYRLKAQRLACKFTLAELAAASDLSIGAISDIENGRQKSSTKLHRLAHALGVTPEWLETGADTRPAISPQPNSTLTDSSETALSRLINNWFASDADGRAFIEQAAKFAATLNRTEGAL